MTEPTIRRGYETSDAALRPLVMLGVALVLLCLLGVGVAELVVPGLERRATRADEAAERWSWAAVPPHGPLLQRNPRADLVEYRDAHEQLLTTYGWVDRDAGIVRVPIERAMELVLERGLGSREPEDGR